MTHEVSVRFAGKLLDSLDRADPEVGQIDNPRLNKGLKTVGVFPYPSLRIWLFHPAVPIMRRLLPPYCRNVHPVPSTHFLVVLMDPYVDVFGSCRSIFVVLQRYTFTSNLFLGPERCRRRKPLL